MAANLSPRPIRPPLELMSAFQNYHPSHDALWKQFEDNFIPQHAPKSQPARELNVELLKNGNLWFVDPNTDLTLLLDRTTGNSPVVVQQGEQPDTAPQPTAAPAQPSTTAPGTTTP